MKFFPITQKTRVREELKFSSYDSVSKSFLISFFKINILLHRNFTDVIQTISTVLTVFIKHMAIRTGYRILGPSFQKCIQNQLCTQNPRVNNLCITIQAQKGSYNFIQSFMHDLKVKLLRFFTIKIILGFISSKIYLMLASIIRSIKMTPRGETAK